MAESKSEAVRRLFAIIPAAGLSRRMGEPKLLLPLAGKTVIRRLMESLREAGIEERIVVCRGDDEPLRREVESAGATAVQPEFDPPDMRTSVEHALRFLGDTESLQSDDGWLLSPADHPMLSPTVLRQVIDHWRQSTAAILVPTFQGKRGHPTVFRWSLSRAVFQLPSRCGLNELLRQRADEVEEFAVGDSSVLFDLDTPADLEELRRRFPC